MSRVTVDVARQRFLTAQWYSGICKNLQFFTGNGDVTVKYSRVSLKISNKRTKVLSLLVSISFQNIRSAAC